MKISRRGHQSTRSASGASRLVLEQGTRALAADVQQMVHVARVVSRIAAIVDPLTEPTAHQPTHLLQLGTVGFQHTCAPLYPEVPCVYPEVPRVNPEVPRVFPEGTRVCPPGSARGSRGSARESRGSARGSRGCTCVSPGFRAWIPRVPRVSRGCTCVSPRYAAVPTGCVHRTVTRERLTAAELGSNLVDSRQSRLCHAGRSSAGTGTPRRRRPAA
jgi:hypothetical protein